MRTYQYCNKLDKQQRMLAKVSTLLIYISVGPGSSSGQNTDIFSGIHQSLRAIVGIEGYFEMDHHPMDL
jgi:hypothetical protein